MRRIAAILLAAITSVGVANAVSSPECGSSGLLCDIADDGTALEIVERRSEPGADDGTRGGSESDESDSGDSGGSGSDLCNEVICREEMYTVSTLPEVTLADLARFVPAMPELVSEPDGVAVAGMPANLIATANTQLIPGTLFDYDVTVRFTPTGYRFDHGDGTTTTTESGGTPWDALGQAQLTPTPTSHVYAERGRYTVHATVLYRADVDFGTGNWRPVTGIIHATSPGQQIRVVEAHTALVQHTCLETPHAPGC